ncbi:two-component response regulator-like APRR3 [Iris pallida]|uniref:Two-component response regulator-like APRR3 n=1 Tax=Iris pallida TaxID=29817 RepID=A0AAX6FCS4_IRIPA|nr:two-component response regulator-like APRR3 [Iris pallida]
MAEPPSTKGKAPRVPSDQRAADHPQSTAGRPASLIRWERFLPRRSLRVLLVEHDDSTRHVVAALLRNCNYHVAGVADGMKAWEVMTERRYCFDLVLTEVATPSLSGIGLLTRIVATEECKNIPVIMMSTHDSVNVVLKCMLKGAVDFLVKPVRKNELRNLWQHVWRRHCSSSYASASDNNTASNQISVDAGDQTKTGENNDVPSNFQSSGTKPDRDIESAQQQTEPPPDEHWRCTMKGGATLDQHDSDVANLASASKIDYGGETRGYKPVGVAVDVTLPIQEASKAEKSPGNHSYDISPSREENLDVVRYSKGDNDNHKSICQNNASNGLVQKKVVFVEPISDGQYSSTVLKKDALVQDGLCNTTKFYHVGDTSNAGTSPLWELSLRRPQTNVCVDPELKENHVLKHSNASAFSRYGDKGIQSSWHKSYSSALCIRTREFIDNNDSYISSSGIDNEKNTPCSPTKDRLPSPRRNEDEATTYLQVSSNNKEKPPTPRDMSADHSSTVGDIALRHPPYGFMPLPIPVGAVPYHNLCGVFGTIMQPVFYPETSLAPLSSAAFGKPVIEIHHYPSSHHSSHLIKHPLSLELPRCEETHKPQHWRQAIDISEPGEQRELSCIPTEQAYQSGSCSHDVLKGSGSNGTGETADGAGATAAALESGNESGVQNCNRRGLDWDRSRREAALLKFRMKRKERCFEKKVRYYSRKKLAEQRPRIKGQFVRKKFPDSPTSEADN